MTTATAVRTVHLVLGPDVRILLERADRELDLARAASEPGEGFLHAHLAALRLAGAVLAATGSPAPRGRPRSAWERLSAAVPELASSAAYFASGASTRSAVETGRGHDVDVALARAWESAAERFRDEVVELLGTGAGRLSPGRSWVS
ncbi:SAV_6107 family HEPN domain-containing protein [Sanguibacter suaedae]|uniref:Colicin transporter n=1 Tax=Sanguibacter suaedae TaxID=2795737 RepID=A0A934ICT3_9MICO|nr:SAV_6107 family HEPN domain-containing protein [Sanguibacter suaedae]MBI9115476.1 colicin transporter [Sanguibacter suaedae]